LPEATGRILITSDHQRYKNNIVIYPYTLKFMALFNFNKTAIQKNNIPKIANSESLITFSEIRNNTLIMKDGSLRAIIKAT
jgi:hypothetical protein